MAKVFCFWLDREVDIHEASVHFTPTNEICRTCGACMSFYAAEAILARGIYEALSADPAVVHNPKALRGVLASVGTLESRLLKRLQELESAK